MAYTTEDNIDLVSEDLEGSTDIAPCLRPSPSIGKELLELLQQRRDFIFKPGH